MEPIRTLGRFFRAQDFRSVAGLAGWFARRFGQGASVQPYQVLDGAMQGGLFAAAGQLVALRRMLGD
eukprot:2632478-Lingulodinium_polyedra.AAC.1